MNAPFGTEGEGAPEWMRKIAGAIADNYCTSKGRRSAHRADIIEAMQGAALAATPAPEVSDEAVDAALNSWQTNDLNSDRTRMRDALQAAFKAAQPIEREDGK